jgi:alginate O-acetyltransferase complex protein AlgI
MVKSAHGYSNSGPAMLFSSVVFIFYFLPIFLVIYYLTGTRNAVLLAGSTFFYIWGEGLFVLLLLILVAFNQFFAIKVERKEGRSRIVLLAIGITANLAVLGFFKYSQFLTNIAGEIFGFTPTALQIHLPLGISFFIFQLVSYLIEVHRRAIPAERDFTRLATYIMMFPHLVAGPIVRYTDIAAELRSRDVSISRVGLGLQYFIVGLSQKVLIANTVAPAADHLFSLPAGSISGASAWVGTFAYSLQIYFDFCGYSNMAIGLAFLLGFRFPINFDYPYSSKSISEFWRRWHMSLSFWFRDYLYIPLGGSKSGQVRTVRNLAIVFLVTGLWHGAAWNFVFWGGLHGTFVIVERLGFANFLKRLPQIISHIYALLVVMIGWIFFRADSFGQAGLILKSMVGLGNEPYWDPLALWVTPEIIAALVIGAILSFPVVPWLLERIGSEKVLGTVFPGMHTNASYVHRIPSSVLLSGFILSVCLLASSSLNPFLYFRF